MFSFVLCLFVCLVWFVLLFFFVCFYVMLVIDCLDSRYFLFFVFGEVLFKCVFFGVFVVVGVLFELGFVGG